MNDGGTTRKYVEIEPGTYNQTVIIAGDVPITLYGSGRNRTDVKIVRHQPAEMAVSEWIEQVNPNGSRFKPEDLNFEYYLNCTLKGDTIGTTCSSVLRIASIGVQLYNLQVQNSNGEGGDGQSVTVKVEADQATLSNVELISRQDTFHTGAPGDYLHRIYVNNSQITGDVDFVFGEGTTIFNGCVFRAVSDRHPQGAMIFAPSTNPSKKYGFLVTNSLITGDNLFKSNKMVHLARSWEKSPYIPGTTSNGQLLIRNSCIESVINVTAPYGSSTGSRPYNGNTATDRDLNANISNRFWEYQNTCDGS